MWATATTGSLGGHQDEAAARICHSNGFDDLGVIAFVFHDDGTEVVRIGQVAHGAVGNVDVLINVVVPVLNLMFKYADNLVGDSVEAQFFADGVLPGE